MKLRQRYNLPARDRNTISKLYSSNSLQQLFGSGISRVILFLLLINACTLPPARSFERNTPTEQFSISPVVLPTATAQADALPPIYKYAIVAALPRDPSSFTQGFAYSSGLFYESAGLYGQSGLRLLDGETGELIIDYPLPPQYFAEGLALVENKIIQLTWRENTAFVYDLTIAEVIDSFTYETEGWGLTYDGQSLIMSDGSSILYYRSPKTFVIEKSLQVTNHGSPVFYLNELEYVDGLIYANVWKSSKVAVIDPLSGYVVGWVDFYELPEIKQMANSERVLNGIAYDEATGRIWITGKNWPVIYEIRIEK